MSCAHDNALFTKSVNPCLLTFLIRTLCLFAFSLTSFDGKMKNNACISTTRQVISGHVFIKQGKTRRQRNRYVSTCLGTSPKLECWRLVSDTKVSDISACITGSSLKFAICVANAVAINECLDNVQDITISLPHACRVKHSFLFKFRSLF